MRKSSVLAILYFVFAIVGVQAQSSGAGSNWDRVRQLPPHTRVHVSADKMSRVCSIDRVEETLLVCSTGRVLATSHYSFPRAEIKSIKVTRYTLSTVGGLGIGAGAGLVVGVAIAHGGGDKLFSNKEVWGVTAAIGGVAGALIGAPTDFLRGPVVYRRP